MNSNTKEPEIWRIIGFMKISPTRCKTLKKLENNILMPSEIAKETELTPSQVSNALHDLKKENLVKCLNEKVRKGRLYQLTDFGKEILDILEETEH